MLYFSAVHYSNFAANGIIFSPGTSTKRQLHARQQNYSTTKQLVPADATAAAPEVKIRELRENSWLHNN